MDAACVACMDRRQDLLSCAGCGTSVCPDCLERHATEADPQCMWVRCVHCACRWNRASLEACLGAAWCERVIPAKASNAAAAAAEASLLDSRTRRLLRSARPRWGPRVASDIDALLCSPSPWSSMGECSACCSGGADRRSDGFRSVVRHSGDSPADEPCVSCGAWRCSGCGKAKEEGSPPCCGESPLPESAATCPSCRTPCVKGDGCPAVTCWACGHSWRWGAPWSTAGFPRILSHDPNGGAAHASERLAAEVSGGLPGAYFVYAAFLGAVCMCDGGMFGLDQNAALALERWDELVVSGAPARSLETSLSTLHAYSEMRDVSRALATHVAAVVSCFLDGSTDSTTAYVSLALATSSASRMVSETTQTFGAPPVVFTFPDMEMVVSDPLQGWVAPAGGYPGP